VTELVDVSFTKLDTTTPTGYPPTSLFRGRHNPQKKYPGTQILQELGRLWRVSDCEELVGVTHRISLGKSHDHS